MIPPAPKIQISEKYRNTNLPNLLVSNECDDQESPLPGSIVQPEREMEGNVNADSGDLELYDGIEVNVNASEDEFGSEEEFDELTEPAEVVVQPSDPVSDQQLASTSAGGQFEEFDHLRDNPAFQRYMAEISQKAADKAVAENIRRLSEAENRGNTVLMSNMEQKRKGVEHIQKSPSDTTIYKPAFNIVNRQRNAIDQISNFVESIRLESADKRDNRGRGKSTEPTAKKTPNKAKDNTGAMAVAEQVILNAEQYKADLHSPKGKIHDDDVSVANPLGPSEVRKLLDRLQDDDDEFFHISCHIDSNLKACIQKGEYVDLDKLMPRDNGGGNVTFDDESKVELVSKGGHTYFKPVKQTQITGLRRWEQAFRVYAAIYTEANPE